MTDYEVYYEKKIAKMTTKEKEKELRRLYDKTRRQMIKTKDLEYKIYTMKEVIKELKGYEFGDALPSNYYTNSESVPYRKHMWVVSNEPW